MIRVFKKLAYMVLMLFIISLISFLAIHIAPNSFLSGGELNPNMTQESIDSLKAVYGLDQPLHKQYLNWLINITTLNFGISFVSGSSVSDEILKRVPITLIINISSLILIFTISLYLGIKSALKYEKKSDYIIRQLSLISFSMPSFYLSLILLILFSLKLGITPLSGLHSNDTQNGLLYYLDMLWHLILPIGVIVFVGFGSLVIYIRSLTLEILKSDYYYFAMTRAIDSKKLLRYYILPNLLPPIATLLGLSLPGLIGGSVILESIFGIDGMGQLFFLSAMSRDYPIIMGILIITAFLTLLGNILADLAMLKLNPFTKRFN